MRLHKKISFIKSIVRIVGFGFLLSDILISVFFLVLAEFLGIFEEIDS